MDAKWKANHAAGMAAAASKTTAHRLTGSTLADVRRRNREEHPCGIKGCKRTSFKGALCRNHWNMVPLTDRLALQLAVIDAQLKVASNYHRRFLRELQAKLAEKAA